jgi:uncharacterized protein YbbK (DUF523 family)/uncharacterized protein YbgA (DUF1722 family)
VTGASPSAQGALRIGISACLLGEEVRYDGGHKRVSFLTDSLASWVEWVLVCPEVEIGLGVPREPIQLVSTTDGNRLRGVESGRDFTQRMTIFGKEKIRTLLSCDLDAYVLKRGSPSCGLQGVQVFAAEGDGSTPTRRNAGRGMFAEALLASKPRFPIIEESDLETRDGQEHFVERILAERRARRFFGEARSAVELAEFFEIHELQLALHSEELCRALAEIVARAAAKSGNNEITGEFAANEITADIAAEFQRNFSAALRVPPSPARHSELLGRILERFVQRSSSLSAGLSAEIGRLVRNLPENRSPRHAVREALLGAASEVHDEFLLKQTCLRPDAIERALFAYGPENGPAGQGRR